MARNSLHSFTMQIEQKRAQAKATLHKQLDFTIDGYFDLLLLKGRSIANFSSSTRSIHPAHDFNLIAQELAKMRELLLVPHYRAIEEQLTIAPTFPSNAAHCKVKSVIKVESGVIPCIDLPSDEEREIKTEEGAQEANAQEANNVSGQMNDDDDDDDDEDEGVHSMPSTSRPFTRSNRVDYSVCNDDKSENEQPSGGSSLRPRPPKRARPLSSLLQANEQEQLTSYPLGTSRQEHLTQCQLCGLSLSSMRSLVNHVRVHTGEQSHRCTWPDCAYTSGRRSNVIAHVRKRHFHLPASKRQQVELGIEDERQASQYCDKI